MVAKSKTLRWAGHVSYNGGDETYIRVHTVYTCVHTYITVVSDGRCRRRWDKNIKLVFKKCMCYVMDYINLAQDIVQWWALVKTVVNLGLR
jgi:hypothetical protein